MAGPGVDVGAGGGLFNDLNASMTLIDSPVSSNTASSAAADGLAVGGGLFNVGSLTLIDSPVTTNAAVVLPGGDALGGGILNGSLFGAALTLIDSPVSGNTPDNCVTC